MTAITMIDVRDAALRLGASMAWANSYAAAYVELGAAGAMLQADRLIGRDFSPFAAELSVCEAAIASVAARVVEAIAEAAQPVGTA